MYRYNSNKACDGETFNCRKQKWNKKSIFLFMFHILFVQRTVCNVAFTEYLRCVLKTNLSESDGNELTD